MSTTTTKHFLAKSIFDLPYLILLLQKVIKQSTTSTTKTRPRDQTLVVSSNEYLPRKTNPSTRETERPAPQSFIARQERTNQSVKDATASMGIRSS